MSQCFKIKNSEFKIVNRTIEISSGTILRTIFILLLLWFLFVIRDILTLVFLALIIVSAIDPIVDWFQKRKIPRPLTVIAVYVIFISALSSVVVLLIPPLTNELRGLGENVPQLAEKITGYFSSAREYALSHNLQQYVSNFLGSAAERISRAGSSVLGGTFSFIGGIFSFVIVLSIAFYMTVQEKGIKKFFGSIVPEEHSSYALGLVDRIQFKMGRWMQGQLFLMLIIFALDYVGLLLIGAPYALVLALIAGILEIIPYIGPIISAVIAVAISFLHDPVTGLLVLGLFVLVQQLEGYVFTPLVMKKAVGLNPVVVILALLIGAKLGGVIGIIVSVPIATVVSEVAGDLIRKREISEGKAI